MTFKFLSNLDVEQSSWWPHWMPFLGYYFPEAVAIILLGHTASENSEKQE